MAEHAGVVTKGRPLQPILDSLGVIRERNARFELLETIIPVAIVQTPGTAREVVIRRYNGFNTFTGAALERAHNQLFNPLGSGVLVRIVKLVPSHNQTGTLRINTSSVALTTLVTGQQGAMDFRVPGIGAAQIREESAVFGAGPGFQKVAWLWNSPAGIISPIGDHFMKGYVLTEGSGIHMIAATDASALTAYWEWDEELVTPLTQ